MVLGLCWCRNPCCKQGCCLALSLCSGQLLLLSVVSLSLELHFLLQL